MFWPIVSRFPVSMTERLIEDSNAIIFTYAVDDRESFSNLEKWMKMVKVHGSEEVGKFLIGIKSDIIDRCVDYEEGKRFADSQGMKFFETSANKWEECP